VLAIYCIYTFDCYEYVGFHSNMSVLPMFNLTRIHVTLFLGVGALSYPRGRSYSSKASSPTLRRLPSTTLVSKTREILPAWLRQRHEFAGEGLGLLEKGLGCTLPESQQESGLSVGAVGLQGASRWRDYPRRSARARSFARS
jgi:hypothetical protein